MEKSTSVTTWCFPSLVDGTGKGWLIVKFIPTENAPQAIVAVNHCGHVFLPQPGEQVGKAYWLVFRVYPNESPFALRDENTGRVIATEIMPGGCHV